VIFVSFIIRQPPNKCKNDVQFIEVQTSPHKWQVHVEVHVPESSNAVFASLKKDALHSLPTSPHVTQAAGTAC